MQHLLKQAVAHIMPWFEQNARPLPWRRSVPDPYRVWLSEIMLQQTRIEAVIPYYLRFLEKFPSVKTLSEADDGELLKAWEGLGYYSRARNLKKAALQIMQEHGGRFPDTEQGLLALSGVGAYTAGAVGSIVFGLPTPAVDGNVLRVVARLSADGRDILNAAVKKEMTAHLRAVWPSGKAAALATQGFMELGQTVCLPNGAPKCEMCPLAAICRAKEQGIQATLPYRTPKKARRVEEKTVFVYHQNGRFLLHHRAPIGLLAGLWEFPSTDGTLSEEDAMRYAEGQGLSPLGILPLENVTHIFTHIEWHMTGYLIEVGNETPPPMFVWASKEEIKSRYAIASAFRAYKSKIAEE